MDNDILISFIMDAYYHYDLAGMFNYAKNAEFPGREMKWVCNCGGTTIGAPI